MCLLRSLLFCVKIAAIHVFQTEGSISQLFLTILIPTPVGRSDLATAHRIRPCLLSKNFQDSPSYRILWHMHRILNVDENKYQLNSLSVIREMNLLSLVSS